MPTIKRPDGVPINVPNKINGVKLRNLTNIPANKILTKTDTDGKEVLIKNDDHVDIREGDKIDNVSKFERG